jgi:hypothetical protein
MAISTANQVDLLWKKIVYGMTTTDVAANKSGSNEIIASPLPLYSNSLWIQDGSIPATPPTSSTAIVHCLTGASRVQATEDTAATLNVTWTTGITNWIPPAFGTNYAVVVYAGDPQTTGTRLYPDTLGYEYTFDYQAGVLNFPGSVPTGVSTGGIYIVGYQYIGETGLSSLSSSIASGTKSQVVANIAARNAITGQNVGDIAFVTDASGIPSDAAPGQYAVYLWNGSVWTVIATQDSGAADDKVVSSTITPSTTGPVALTTARANATCVSIQVNVSSAFDGTLALSVGTSANNTQLIDTTESDLQTAGTYVLNMNTQLSNSADTPVNIYLTGTSTVGSCVVTITFA